MKQTTKNQQKQKINKNKNKNKANKTNNDDHSMAPEAKLWEIVAKIKLNWYAFIVLKRICVKERSRGVFGDKLTGSHCLLGPVGKPRTARPTAPTPRV